MPFSLNQTQAAIDGKCLASNKMGPVGKKQDRFRYLIYPAIAAHWSFPGKPIRD